VLVLFCAVLCHAVLCLQAMQSKKAELRQGVYVKAHGHIRNHDKKVGLVLPLYNMYKVVFFNALGKPSCLKQNPCARLLDVFGLAGQREALARVFMYMPNDPSLLSVPCPDLQHSANLLACSGLLAALNAALSVAPCV
jgi:hypothetical protein